MLEVLFVDHDFEVIIYNEVNVAQPLRLAKHSDPFFSELTTVILYAKIDKYAL